MTSHVHIKSLDGLRGIAILMIMGYHANLAPFAWISMQLFFVLSGFLITSILWVGKQEGGNRKIQYVRFWVRRALRIFPLYFAWLIGLGAIYLITRFPSYYEQYFFSLITYTFNFTRDHVQWQGNPLFTHLWSLSVEEQFYLFFPLIVIFFSKRVTQVLLPLCILLAPLLRFVLFRFYSNEGLAGASAADAVYWNILSHIDAFSFGGLLVVLPAVRRVKPLLIACTAIGLVVSAGLWMLSQGPISKPALATLGYLHNDTRYYAYVWHYSLLNLLFASIVLVLIHPGSAGCRWLDRLMSMPWLMRIGRVSYGMYIFHWAVLTYVVNRYVPQEGQILRFVAFFPYAAAVYALAEISFRFFETPFLQLKDLVFRKHPSTSAFPNEPGRKHANLTSAVKKN